MNELQIFKNSEFGAIRTVTKDGEPWFVASDVAKALGYRMASDMTRRIDEEDKGYTKVRTPGGEQEMSIINESGLYAGVFCSSIDSAKSFKHWVTSEVLPSIRKNGGYIANQEQMTPEQIVANALIVAQNIISQKDRQIEEMKPKADFFDAVADSKTAISMNDVAKVLSIKGYGRNNLFEFLRNEGILNSSNLPYQKYVDAGWFRVIEQKYMKNSEVHINMKTLIYQKGVNAIRKKLEKAQKG